MNLLTAMIHTAISDRQTEEQRRMTADGRLRRLVAYARKNSPFYRRLYQNINDDFELGDLPAVSKAQLMSDFDNVLTDRTVTTQRVEQFMEDPDHIGRMMDGKYLVFRTSGSTGIPAVVLYDRQMIAVSSAIAAVRTFARQEDFRRFMKNGRRTAGVFADHGFYLACGMSRHMQLKMPWSRSKITVNVNDPEEEIIQQLNEFQPSMLSGYPSNLSLLADHEELNIHPDVVITGGELLTPAVRRKLNERFGCYVQTHYSCTEGGEIACECSEGHLHVNSDWVIVEPVDRNNQPVGCDVLSDKVLITCLANHIQPFIRYELSDRIILHQERCSCGRDSCWLEIEGRTDDTLTFADNIRIAPMTLYRILEEIDLIRRFQLIQRSDDLLELRLEAENREEAFAAAEKDLMDFFTGRGLHGIRIVLSSDLPGPDPISGKYRHIFREEQNL